MSRAASTAQGSPRAPDLGLGLKKSWLCPFQCPAPNSRWRKCRAELRFWVALCRRVLFYLHFLKAAITKVHS